MDRGAWRATVHSITKSRTLLTRLGKHASRNDIRDPELSIIGLPNFKFGYTAWGQKNKGYQIISLAI